MDSKLRKDILRILKDTGYACKFNKLEQILMEKYNYERVIEGSLDVFSNKVLHQLSLLENDGLIKKETTQSMFFSLYSKGYAEFDPIYKKAWKFFKDDFAKILSVVATILSIIAMVISLVK